MAGPVQETAPQQQQQTTKRNAEADPEPCPVAKRPVEDPNRKHQSQPMDVSTKAEEENFAQDNAVPSTENGKPPVEHKPELSDKKVAENPPSSDHSEAQNGAELSDMKAAENPPPSDHSEVQNGEVEAAGHAPDPAAVATQLATEAAAAQEEAQKVAKIAALKQAEAAEAWKAAAKHIPADQHPAEPVVDKAAETAPAAPQENSKAVESAPAAPQENAKAAETAPAAPQENAKAAETAPAAPQENAKAAETAPAAPQENAMAAETAPAAPQDNAKAAETTPAAPQESANPAGAELSSEPQAKDATPSAPVQPTEQKIFEATPARKEPESADTSDGVSPQQPAPAMVAPAPVPVPPTMEIPTPVADKVFPPPVEKLTPANPLPQTASTPLIGNIPPQAVEALKAASLQAASVLPVAPTQELLEQQDLIRTTPLTQPLDQGVAPMEE